MLLREKFYRLCSVSRFVFCMFYKDIFHHCGFQGINRTDRDCFNFIRCAIMITSFMRRGGGGRHLVSKICGLNSHCPNGGAL
jgi:hypothetical protein